MKFLEICRKSLGIDLVLLSATLFSSESKVCPNTMKVQRYV